MSTSSLSPTSTLQLHTGRSIPHLGYGVYQARGDECTNGVKEAVKRGWKMIDSAQGYRNESICGTALLSASVSSSSQSSSPGESSNLKRSQIYLCTKYMPAHHPHPTAQILKLNRKSAADFDQLSPREGGEAYVDMILVHAPWGGEKGRAHVWEAMAQSQKEGVTRDIGVSNHSIAHLSALPPPLPAVNQIELHPWCQQRDLVAYCQEKGIAVQAYAPLARAEEKKWGDGRFQRVVKRVEARHAQHKGPGEAEGGGERKEGGWEGRVLIRWSMQKGYIPLIKSTKPSRITANLDVFDFELTDEDMLDLDALDMGKEGAITWNPLDQD